MDGMEDPKETRKAFAALLSLPDDAIDLGHAALLIAREEYPDLDVGRYLARLDGMAEEIARRMRGREGATSLVAHLNRLLFEEMGFRGNREEYHDPRNSFLNDVLDRRIGIPITLSTVYLEVGRRILEEPNPPAIILISSREASDYGGGIERSGARGFISKAELSARALEAVLDGEAM